MYGYLPYKQIAVLLRLSACYSFPSPPFATFVNDLSFRGQPGLSFCIPGNPVADINGQRQSCTPENIILRAHEDIAVPVTDSRWSIHEWMKEQGKPEIPVAVFIKQVKTRSRTKIHKEDTYRF